MCLVAVLPRYLGFCNSAIHIALHSTKFPIDWIQQTVILVRLISPASLQYLEERYCLLWLWVQGSVGQAQGQEQAHLPAVLGHTHLHYAVFLADPGCSINTSVID